MKNLRAKIAHKQGKNMSSKKVITHHKNADAMQTRMCYDDIVPNWEKKSRKAACSVNRTE